MLAALDAGRGRYVLIWALVLLLLCAGAVARVVVGGASPIGSNVKNLMPNGQGDALLAAADRQNSNAFLQGMVIAIQGPAAGTTTAAAQSALAALTAAGYRNENPGRAADALYNVYRRHRFRLLTRKDRAALAKRPKRAFVTALEVGLASPGSPAGTLADPGGYLTRWLASLPRAFSTLTPAHGMLAATEASQPTYVLIFSLKGDAFSPAGERRAQHAIALARKTVAAHCPRCSVSATAPALFSAAERAETKHEVIWLSVGSSLIIVLLVLAFFRSLRPLAIVAVGVASGIAFGGAVTLIVFGVVNLLTLILGTTLIGISVDYALYYLADRRLNGRGTLLRIAPGVTLALAVTCIAFAFLAATPFAPLRQMAVFSIVGLIGAVATVGAVFPMFSRSWGQRPAPASLRWAMRMASGGRRHWRWRAILTVVLIAGVIGGLLRLRAEDNLRELQALPPHLVAVTAKVTGFLGTSSTAGFFLVRGPDLASALARERALTARAAKRAPKLALIGLAGFLPSPAAQKGALAAWTPLMRDGGAPLHSALAEAGLPTGFATRLNKVWEQKGGALRAAQLLQTLPALERFVVHAGGDTGAIVQIYGKATPGALAALAHDSSGVTYVNTLARLNAVFAHIRKAAVLWVAIGYAVTLLLLGWRYGPIGGFVTLLSPLTAALVTLGILGWLGEPVNVFVVVALMLVAGVGADYALFLHEGEAHRGSTGLAVVLAAVCALGSFGLLAASRIPALHEFGLTVAIGIAVAWLVAPLTLLRGRRKLT
jgi:predicted exporter